ncbi:MAG: M20/M25/M40 family metallo-hydrolase, partial [Omnitrophica WOR_2 bacterium]
RVEAGFLHFTDIGGVDPRVLPGQPVTVYGREELPGIVVQPPLPLLPTQHREGPTPMEYLLVDTGLSPERLARLVRPGDLVSFAQPPFELSGETLAGHSLDDRASVAALTCCLDELKTHAPSWDVYAVATVQEEISYAGASTSTFQLQPSLAVAVDVTFGASPGSPSHETYPLGKGIVLGYGPNIHPALFKAFKDLADRLEIPYSIEAIPGGSSGTDATAMQVTTEGFPSMVLAIPLRYMHTPVEVVSIKDIQRAGRLLAGFIAGVDGEFMQKIAWEE